MRGAGRGLRAALLTLGWPQTGGVYLGAPPLWQPGRGEPRPERLLGDVALEGWGIRVTASGVWAGGGFVGGYKKWSWAPVRLVLANTVPAPPLAHRPPAGPLSLARKQTLEGGSHVAAAHSCKPARLGLPGESRPALGPRQGEKGGSAERSPRCAAVRSPPVLLAGGSAWGL